MKVSEGGRWLTGAGLGVAVVLLGAGVGQADTQVPLPDGEQALTTATGVQVDLTRTGEQAVLSPSLASNGLSRTASMSGTVFATIDGATSGTLQTGYVVGCQVDLGSGVHAKGSGDSAGQSDSKAGGSDGGALIHTIAARTGSPCASPRAGKLS
ncbi:MspA family porin [Nocardia sp. alder85J]|uniref:MspA family porin n=1 Tax=Nocardia sp. alder85J TaxID=2862949 RepID=UPI001CD3B37F|nr:MspA family porin [Nocardia sp. alder85J]MCX4098084.1 MspA family porin [Nocardia sp. alder85J]